MNQGRPSAFSPLASDILALEAQDMARRRWGKGHLYERNGRWYVRYRVDQVERDAQGSLKLKRVKDTPVELGPSKGPGKLTLTQAKARRDEVMAGVMTHTFTPQSLITVAEFISEKFEREYVPALKPGGQKHYRSMLKHVVAWFGVFALRDLNKGHVKRALAQLAEKYSKETLTKIRNTLHTVYAYADDIGFFKGQNPASRVKIPECAAEPVAVEGYSVEEAQRILSVLESPLREMAMLSMATSMHAAELAGLRAAHMNLGTAPRSINGVTVPPNSLLVCESVYLNKRSTTKTRKRRRVLPIPANLQASLREMISSRAPADPVFIMPRTLRMNRKSPVDPHNITNRTFAKLSEALGIAVNWHRFRHTHATLTDHIGLEERDRVEMMGHGDSRTTERYTHAIERKRAAADRVLEMLARKEEREPEPLTGLVQ